jgi:hypothetical protein
VIEDMLRMYVMDKPSKWEDYLHSVEFSYNNGYQTSLKMSPFEALYGRKYNTLVRWDNPEDRVVVGPDLLMEMEEKMLKIKQNLKVSQDRKKIYDDKGRTHREFKVRDYVLLKVKANRNCNTPRPNPIVNVNENVLKLVSCLISFLYAPFMV